MQAEVDHKLHKLYGQAATNFFKHSRIRPQYVGPFLVSHPDGYFELGIPWMYIGQETSGWLRMKKPSQVSKLMSAHSWFSKHNGRARSPFWPYRCVC